MGDRKSTGISIFLFLLSASAWPYAVPTHVWLTDSAFDRSVLARDPSFVGNLGLSSIEEKLADSVGDERNVKELFASGAEYEDSGLRPLNHFFDPQNGGRGLTVGVQVGQPSLRWVLEDSHDYADQGHSIRHALGHFYLALTNVSEGDRKAHLGVLFESIGRAIHHLQDMAQPEHVRNDQHLPTPSWVSAYEGYTEEQTRGGRLSRGAPYGVQGVVDLRVFAKARSFWEREGKGIAEFTSRNFLSRDTQFLWPNPANGLGPSTDPDYRFPQATPCAGRQLLELVSPASLGDALDADFYAFVGTNVSDAYLGESSCNSRTTSLSVFTEDTARRKRRYVFSPNRRNFDAAHEFLISRAIAYSAGFIDHFFRGRIEVESLTLRGDRAALKVQNTSAADFVLADTTNAGQIDEFEIWYDAIDGTRKQADALNANLQGKVIAANQTHEIDFRIPVDIDRNKHHPYTLVFRGVIGEEEGVICQTFGGSGAVVINPSVIPRDGVLGSRILNRKDGGWELSPVRGALAGNVDWKGVSGDVVTWDGPQSRYFLSSAQRNGVSPNIYVGGALVAKAPGNVLGAAMRPAKNGRDLIAATINGGTLTIYARSMESQNESSSSVSANPYGWRSLGAAAIGLPDSPVFFNASASEAQVMADGFRYRYKISIGAGAATAVQVKARGRGEHQSHTDWSTSSSMDGDSGYSYFSTSHQSKKIDWIEPTIVCVDYVGDREVFCKIVGGPTASSEGTMSISCPFTSGGCKR
ncbi:MAG TPA: hypothetical protein VK629_15380, partial [Steroidobacteraceae bacterium]|nr:hypothetical protein [Steroidobacteraceae bacterium]